MQPEPLQTPKATLTVLSRIEAVDEELQRLAQCCVLLGHHSANVAFDEDQQTIPEIGDFWITQRYHRGALLGRRRGEELDEEDLPKEDGALGQAMPLDHLEYAHRYGALAQQLREQLGRVCRAMEREVAELLERIPKSKVHREAHLAEGLT